MLRLVVLAYVLVMSSHTSVAETLKVAMINHSPWGYTNPNGDIAGQHVDYFTELAKRSGLDFKFQLVPVPRVKNYLQNGKADVTVFFRRVSMADFVEFVSFIRPYNYYLVGKKGHYFDESNLNEAELVGFGKGEGDVVKKCFTDKYKPSSRLTSVSNYRNLLRMLSAERIDAAIIPSKALNSYLNEIGADQSAMGQLFVLCRNEAYLQLSKKSRKYSPEIVQRLRTAMDSMREDGTIELIAAKYQEVK